MALRSDGTVLGWDKDGGGVPKEVKGVRNAVEVAAGNARACARIKDGSLWCWGYDGFGELGRGVLPKDQAINTFPPFRVPGVTGVTAMALSGHHTCVLLKDTTSRCWGMAEYGRLGNGVVAPYSQIPTPQPVRGLKNAVGISSSRDGMFTCALRSDATVACWGWNAYGELGNWDNEKEQEATPYSVKAKWISGAKQIATSNNTACALLEDATVRCWGGSVYGEVGDGSTNVRARPVQVAGLRDVVELGGGETNFCARRKDGTVWCWGRSDFGQCGDGSVNRRQEPVEISF